MNGDVRHTLMPFGFQCGDGWFDILWRLCVDLEPLVAELEKETGDRFEVVQVKQKVGTLRFYVSHHAEPHQRAHRGGPEGILTHLRGLRGAGPPAGDWRPGRVQ